MALNSNFRTLTADNIEGIVEDRNYLKSSFENGTITGWTEVAVALTSGLPTGTPTIGATAASSLALSATSVTPLSGSRSLLVDVPSALTAGHGFISDEFTLDRMDLGKVLTVSFDYERVTGTYNFSGTLGSQTWMVYIYDATLGAANWIQPAGFLGMNQSSGPGRVRATFQSSVTAGQKYRVAVIASQAAAGASSIEFDNFTCSRQTAPIGPVVTDWVSYTPTFTGFGTPTNVSFFWRRSGDSLEINATFTTGTCTATEARISLPSGLTLDSSKISGNLVVGYGGLAGSPTPVNVLATGGHTYFRFAPNSNLSTVANNANSIFSNATAVSFQAFAPITGWSSNVQLSNDTDTRVVAAYCIRDITAYTIPVGSSTFRFYTPLLNASVVDTHASLTLSGSDTVYRIPVSGVYDMEFALRSSAGASNVTIKPIIEINGSARNNDLALTGTGIAETIFSTVGTDGRSAIVRAKRFLNAGDVVRPQILRYENTATSVEAGSSYFSVSRLSGPSVVAASETVAYRGTRNAGNYVLNNATATYVPNSTSYDTHGAMNTSTGTYTVPVSGIYEAMFRVTFFTNVNGAFANAKILMAGESFDSWTAIDSTNPNYRTIVSFSSRRMNAGDTITAQVFFPSNNATFVTDSSFTNIFQIKRIGN